MSAIKVVHLITCFNPGGAENVLYRLLAATNRSAFEPEVISMMGVGVLGERARTDLGLRVRALGLGRGIPNPAALAKLVSWLREDPPDVLATWMYHANFLGSLASIFAGKVPVVWGLHHSRLDPAIERRRTLRVAKLCAWMSHRYAAGIICCAESTRAEHLDLGYAEDNMEVICNGFDTSVLRPDPSARRPVREELRLPQESRIVSLPARFHPQKDHRNFVRAAAWLRERMPDAYFVMYGQCVDDANPELSAWVREAGLGDRCRLLGMRDDAVRLMAASDVVCLSSVQGEALPLAIGEAMSCGIPCVVTDIGDSAALVGDTGLVVPPSDPEALAGAIEKILRLKPDDYASYSRRARARIKMRYEMALAVARYEAHYRRVARSSVQMVESGMVPGKTR